MNNETAGDLRQNVGDAISQLWWLVLLRGIVLVILGIYALAKPGMTLMVFTQLLGAFLLVDGVLAIVAGIMGWSESRGWTIARGVLGIVIGVFVLGHSAVVGVIAATTVVIVIAIQSLVSGILEIVVAIRERKQIEGEGWLILSGVLTIIFGIILLLAPFASSLTLIRILGVFAIIFGVALCVMSFRVRKLGKAIAAS